ncbi:MAG: hypothetical protein OEW39_06980 [Deltaproteobacteria bacterium]|nr:hypothetical protein [Deltaproteobacteria bacterium]
MKKSIILPAMMVFLVSMSLNTNAIEIQVGLGNGIATKHDCIYSECEEKIKPIMPIIAIGTIVDQETLIFLQIDTSKNEFDMMDSIFGNLGTYKISTTYYTAVFVPRWERFDLRLGFGYVIDKYSLETSDNYGIILSWFGITNVKYSIENAKGAQTLYGFDFRIGKTSAIGFEIRNINVRGTGTLSYTWGDIPYSEQESFTMNRKMSVARLVMNF